MFNLVNNICIPIIYNNAIKDDFLIIKKVLQFNQKLRKLRRVYLLEFPIKTQF